MLTLGRSLPSLLPSSNTINNYTSLVGSIGSNNSGKDGPVIASVTCSSKDVRTFWETLHPKHVIELNSIQSALAYFAKPVDSVLNLPNMVIGDIHLSTSAGQSLVSYLGILKIPYVLIGTRGHAAKAQLYGAIDFVYKPVNAFRLKHAFNLAMNKLPRSRKYAIQDMMVEDEQDIDAKAKEFYESKRRFSRSSSSRSSIRRSNSRNRSRGRSRNRSRGKSRGSNRSISPSSSPGGSRKKRSNSPENKKTIDFSEIEDGGWKA